LSIKGNSPGNDQSFFYPNGKETKNAGNHSGSRYRQTPQRAYPKQHKTHGQVNGVTLIASEMECYYFISGFSYYKYPWIIDK
jgi:hypothetical protein